MPGLRRQMYDTPVPPAEVQAYLRWKQQNAPRDSGEDYDLQGAYRAQLVRRTMDQHLPDTFKKPNHPTFSNESMYAPLAPLQAGSWAGEVYRPAPLRRMIPPEVRIPFR